MFGLAPGHLTKRQQRAVERAGAVPVNYTDAQCTCGFGCRPFKCKRSQRHWLEIQNLGDGLNQRRAGEVLAALAAVNQEH